MHVHQMPSLWTIDPQTVNYVLTRAYEFEKPMEGRKHTARLIGKSEFLGAYCADSSHENPCTGILVSEGMHTYDHTGKGFITVTANLQAMYTRNRLVSHVSGVYGSEGFILV